MAGDDHQIKRTSDGSNTLLHSELNEHYHSMHGALSESVHVFIENGLLHVLQQNKSSLRILEVGFGTGLNFLLTWEYLMGKDIKWQYEAVEPHPLRLNSIKSMGYAEKLENRRIEVLFEDLYASSLESASDIPESTGTLRIHKCTLDEFNSQEKFDLVYFDAFSPTVQPEMWSDELLSHTADMMNPGACLVTYCVRGHVRRAFKNLGFETEKLPGPPGKREMLRVTKA